MILDPFHALHTTADIHGKGTDLSYGLGYVVGIHSARENQGLTQTLRNQAPIEAQASTTRYARHICIQQNTTGVGVVIDGRLQSHSWLNTQRLDEPLFKGRA